MVSTILDDGMWVATSLLKVMVSPLFYTCIFEAAPRTTADNGSRGGLSVVVAFALLLLLLTLLRLAANLHSVPSSPSSWAKTASPRRSPVRNSTSYIHDK